MIRASSRMLLVVLLACDVAEPPGRSPTEAPTANLVPAGTPVRTLARVTFDRVPIPGRRAVLDYANTRREPLSGAHWQVLVDDVLVDLGTTQRDGSFTFEAPAGATAEVIVLAESREHRVTVVDNTRGDAIYSDLTTLRVTGADLDIHLPIIHDGSRYVDRTGAPFAILDTIHRMNEALLSVVDLDLEPLTVHWSVNNQPVDGDPTQGEIGNSLYHRATGIWLLGAEDIDTDELDEGVIAHEWGHYFTITQSRCDSLGGPHSAGTVLHPAVAFSEGVATALGAIHAGLSVYQDTRGLQQSTGFTWFLDDNRAGPAIGFYGKRSVASVLWDLYDGGPNDDDDLNVPLRTLLEVWLEDLPSTPAMVAIQSFGFLLAQRIPDDLDALYALYEREDIVRPVDPWGIGETNDGGVPDAVRGALFLPLLREGLARFTEVGPGVPGHQLQEYRFRRFLVPSTSRQRLDLTSEGGPMRLRVYRQGRLLCVGHSDDDGIASCNWRGEANETVILEVSGNLLEEPTDATLRFVTERPDVRPDEGDERDGAKRLAPQREGQPAKGLYRP